MAVGFMHTAAPVTSQRDLERRLAGGVRFLQTGQVATDSPRAGAWPSSMLRGARVREDWNAFTTALTSTACAAVEEALPATAPVRDDLAAMQFAAAAFLQTSAADSPPGAYRFWPLAERALPGPDLDDTALVHLALRTAGCSELDEIDCLRLFGPYRLTSGSAPHGASTWAAGFPGVFGTWMNDGEPIVDVCVNANVMRVLQQCGAGGTAAYRAAGRMLAVFLKLRTLPLDVSPYYRSSSMLAWLCAQLDYSEAELSPGQDALACALDERLEDASESGAPFEDLLLLQSARARRGLALNPSALERLLDAQCADGGWPPIGVCWNFAGTLRWTSRSFPSALALGLLVSELRGTATC